jgi:hypothetical protein
MINLRPHLQRYYASHVQLSALFRCKQLLRQLTIFSKVVSDIPLISSSPIERYSSFSTLFNRSLAEQIDYNESPVPRQHRKFVGCTKLPDWSYYCYNDPTRGAITHLSGQ